VIAPTTLRSFALLSELDDATLADVARTMRHCSYRPGDYIAFEGERPAGIFFVVQGRVRLSRTAPDGREQVLAMVGARETFNAVPLFDEQPTLATARAMSPVVCLMLPRAALLDLIGRHPTLALAALRDMASQLRDLVILVEDLAFRSVRERMARQLLREASDGFAEVTHQDLAERTGTVREIAGRVLRRLAQEGLVRLERGRVIVLDAEGLARIVDATDVPQEDV
jgi:CRP/FNR family transcriptional regulator